MKFNEFKHIFYKISEDYGFKKEGKAYIYRNEEVMIVFGIEKSNYSNSISRYGLGINPYEIIEEFTSYDKIPDYYDIARVKYSFVNNEYIDLDKLDSTEIKVMENKLRNFFENDFANYSTLSGLKTLLKENKIKASDYILEYWNI